MFFDAYCFLCRNVFDGATCRPLVGKCEHNMCTVCYKKLTSPDCPLCERKDAFKMRKTNAKLDGSMGSLKAKLTDFQFGELIKFVQLLDVGQCANCGKEDMRNRRACLDCNQDSSSGCNIHDPNYQFRIYPTGSVYTILAIGNERGEINAHEKDLFICVECTNEFHADHKTIPIMQIDNTFLYKNNIILHDFIKCQGVVLKVDMESYNQWAHLVAAWQRKGEVFRTSCFPHISLKVEGRKVFNEYISVIPWMAPEFRRAEEAIYNAAWKSRRLEFYYVMIVKQELERHIGMLVWTRHLTNNRDWWQHTEAAIHALRLTLRSMPKHLLSAEEAKSVDDEIEERLESIGRALPTPSELPEDEEPDYYLKYRVLMEEINSKVVKFADAMAITAKTHEELRQLIAARRQQKRKDPGAEFDDTEIMAKLDELVRVDVEMHSYGYSQYFVYLITEKHFHRTASATERKYNNLIGVRVAQVHAEHPRK